VENQGHSMTNWFTAWPKELAMVRIPKYKPRRPIALKAPVNTGLLRKFPSCWIFPLILGSFVGVGGVHEQFGAKQPDH